MPICITCSTPVPSLYTTYSKADDRSLGKGVRLTQCPKCKHFADKYVEHDFVVLFIDLVLIKPQVYRHLLFNRLSSSSSSPNKFDPSILRLGPILVLFDVYLTWARIERSSSLTSAFNDAPILTQYLFFLTLNIIATGAQHFTIRTLVHRFLTGSTSHSTLSPRPPSSSSNGSPDKDSMAGTPSSPPPPMAAPGRATPAAISTALLVSSCTKLFPILLVIWPTSIQSEDGAEQEVNSNATFASRASSYVGWAVLINNIEALLILLDCGYIVATGLAVAGAVARFVVEKLVLGMVGLNGDASGGTGSVLSKIGDIIGVG